MLLRLLGNDRLLRLLLLLLRLRLLLLLLRLLLMFLLLRGMTGICPPHGHLMAWPCVSR